MSIAQKCKIEGCVGLGVIDPKYGRRLRKGYCQNHYQNLKRHGDPLFSDKLRSSRPVSCKTEGCKASGHTHPDGSQYFVNGYCRTHYTRLRNTGKLDRTTNIRGAYAHPLKDRWNAMMSRCYDSRHISYKSYGGRGIIVCERWHTFDNFVKDLGVPPEGMTLDRIDCNGNYEPSNCRWATLEQQANNRRNSTYLTIDGKTMTIEQWGRYSVMYPSTIRRRIAKGYDAKTAVFGKRERNRRTTKAPLPYNPDELS